MTVPAIFNPASRLAWAFYTFALLLIIMPIVDVTTNVWPLNFGLAEWRYGMLGLTSNYLQTPLLGLVLAGAVAVWQDHRNTLRTLAIVSLVAGAGLAAGLGMFGLDVVEVRQAVSQDALAMFKVGAMKAAFKYGVAITFALFLAHALWRAGAPDTGTLAEAGPADVDWRPQGGTSSPS